MEYIKLSEVCHTIGRGKAITKSIDGDVYALGFTDISFIKIRSGSGRGRMTPKCKLQNEYEDLKMYNIEIMDIVLPPITRKNLYLKLVKALEENEKVIYSSRAIYIRVNKEKYSPNFLYKLLSTEKYKKRLLEEAYTKSTSENTFQISIAKLKEFEIPKISIDKQEEILQEEQKITEEFDEIIKTKEQELKALYKKF